MSSTGVGSGVATGVGLLATGGVGCPRSHPQTTKTTKQTAAADLKRFTLAPVVRNRLTIQVTLTAARGNVVLGKYDSRRKRSAETLILEKFFCWPAISARRLE
jgi:hypothetical protein